MNECGVDAMSLTTPAVTLAPVARAETQYRSGGLSRAVPDACPKRRPSCPRFPGCGGVCALSRSPRRQAAKDTYTRHDET